MSDKWKDRGQKVAGVVKRGAEITANGVYKVTNTVARNEDRVADGAQAVTRVAGSSLNKAVQEISAAGQRTGKVLHDNADRVANLVQKAVSGSDTAGGWRKAAGGFARIVTKLSTHAVGLGADAIGVVGKVSARAGRLTEASAPVVGGAVGGVVRGAVKITADAFHAAALPVSRLDAMRAELRLLGRMELERSQKKKSAIDSAKRRQSKEELLDLLVVGGVSLAQVLRDPASVPADVEKAFTLAYPRLANSESFSDAVDRMSSDQLVGLTAGVKGKLFEIELVNHLNGGGLPDGFHAELASFPNQPGWDIKIFDDQGQVSELLQAKATESVQYVREALERYPEIDVTTTTEVHAQLVAMGMAQDVHNSGITDSALQVKIDAATHSGSAFGSDDLVPSAIGLSVIALSVFMGSESTAREKGAAFGSRSAKAGASSAVAKVAMIATQTWWLGLMAGVGSSWLASVGRGKRNQYEALRVALKTMERRKGGEALMNPG